MSDRERTVLLLAAEGLTDKEIARHLELSQRTIGTYWERMRLKLGPFSRTQLVARFLRVESADEGSNYRNLFATWEDGVWILSPYGATIYANARVASIFGLTPNEFRETGAHKLLANLVARPVEELLASARNGIQSQEFRFVRPDGATVWLRMSASAVNDPRGRCSAIIFLFSDTTVQRRVVQALESCESTFAFLSEHSSDMIARFDAELTCISINPQFLKGSNHGGGEIVGRPIHELASIFRPVDEWIRNLTAVIQTGEDRSFGSDCAAGEGSTQTYLRQERGSEPNPAGIISITTVAST
ncbi:PAS domain-containing protein [Fimbriimonas ginsengisoli]|uniref:PAS domain-containing protein n=1 Tax=Fimbriimonas ginsengisoli TaxID=1005039 RepID=UPI00130E37E3|nr:PAS domain-containing protein [Fimbriimonas ginsengisoli]